MNGYDSVSIIYSSVIVVAVFSFIASFISAALRTKNKQTPSITQSMLGMYIALIIVFAFLLISDLIINCMKNNCQTDFSFMLIIDALLYPIPFAIIAGIPPSLFIFADYLQSKK